MAESTREELHNHQFVFNRTIKYRFPTHTNLLLMGREDSQASEVYLVDYEVGEATNVHCHKDGEQLFYVLEGEGVVQFGEGPEVELPIRPGDLVRTPVGVPHRVINKGISRLRYLCVECFPYPQEGREASWDEHVRSNCQANGWDYEQVRRDNE